MEFRRDAFLYSAAMGILAKDCNAAIEVFVNTCHELNVQLPDVVEICDKEGGRCV